MLLPILHNYFISHNFLSYSCIRVLRGWTRTSFFQLLIMNDVMSRDLKPHPLGSTINLPFPGNDQALSGWKVLITGEEGWP